MKKLLSFMLIIACVLTTPVISSAEDAEGILHFADKSTPNDFFEGYVVDVPAGWVCKDFEGLLAMYPTDDTSIIFALDKIDYGETLDRSYDDLTLRFAVESMLGGAIGEDNISTSKKTELSNHEPAAIATGTNFETKNPQFGIGMSKFCGDIVFVLLMFGDLSMSTEDGFYDDLDSILCSVRETK